MSVKIGIDLGTSNTVVGLVGKGILFTEPTVVAISTKDKTVLAIGFEAKSMLGKVPSDIEARRPIIQGVIASYKITEIFLHSIINKILGRFRLSKPEIMISVPSGITSVEERAVIEAAVQAGAGKVYLIPEPIASAIGAKMPIGSSEGSMVVSMGGGTSEIAVISLNGLVTFESRRVAGDSLNESLVIYIRKRYNLIIGEQMAEKIKISIGSATIIDKPIEMEIRGRDSSTGMPASINTNSNEIVDGFKPILNQIILSIKNVLEVTPPELSSDIIDRGMVLTGGTSLLRNIDDLFTKAINVPAHIVEDPTNTVIKGILYSLENIESIRRSLRG
jgi:rod shape-determining protein MreB